MGIKDSLAFASTTVTRKCLHVHEGNVLSLERYSSVSRFYPLILRGYALRL